MAGQRHADRQRCGAHSPGAGHAPARSLDLYSWYVFSGVAAFSLLTKYAIRYRGSHVFNPSNVGLVVTFLVFGSTRVEPLDFWWAP